MRLLNRQLGGLLFSLLCCSAGCSGQSHSGQPTKEPRIKVVDAQSARTAFVEYLSSHGKVFGWKSAADLANIEVEIFGSSTWLVHATDKTQPSSTFTFIADGDGVREATLQNLIYAHTREFPASSDEKDHRKVIDSLIKLHSSQKHRHRAILISSTKDIPGYHDPDNGVVGRTGSWPLDPDLRNAVRPSWKEERPTMNALFYVVYTYNQMGGVVSRYKLRFDATSRDANGRLSEWRFSGADHIVLGKDIGNWTGRK